MSKIIMIAVVMILSLSGCGETITTTTTTVSTTNYGDGNTIVECNDNIDTNCSVIYPGEELKTTDSLVTGAIATDAYGTCPVGYSLCSENVCVPEGSTCGS